MQDRPQDQTFSLADVDFEAFYQGKPAVEGCDVGLDKAPWDIGEPQPPIVALEASGVLRSAILDAGCGLGEHSIFLAERGYQVTGFDASPTAIAQARERAMARGVDIQLAVADATRLDGFQQRFNTVLDSALYHCLTDQARTEYAKALHRVTQPGAHLYLFGFADIDRAGVRLPLQIGQDDLYAHLGNHWDIHGIELTHYTTAFGVQQTKDVFGSMITNADALQTDRRGRVIIPTWQLDATRK